MEESGKEECFIVQSKRARTYKNAKDVAKENKRDTQERKAENKITSNPAESNEIAF